MLLTKFWASIYSEMLLKVADEPFLSDSTYNGKHSAKFSKLYIGWVLNSRGENQLLTSICGMTAEWPVAMPSGNGSNGDCHFGCWTSKRVLTIATAKPLTSRNRCDEPKWTRQLEESRRGLTASIIARSKVLRQVLQVCLRKSALPPPWIQIRAMRKLVYLETLALSDLAAHFRRSCSYLLCFLCLPVITATNFLRDINTRTLCNHWGTNYQITPRGWTGPNRISPWWVSFPGIFFHLTKYWP